MEFEDRFQISAEDGSIKDVARYLIQLYNECSEGKFESVKVVVDRAAALPPAKFTITAGGRAAFGEDEDDGDDGEEGEEHGEGCTCGRHGGSETITEEEPPKAEISEVDADGWTTVKPKNKRR